MENNSLTIFSFLLASFKEKKNFKSINIYSISIFVKTFLSIVLLSLFSLSMYSQELDWLQQSTSVNLSTNHSFYASAVYKNNVYFSGDFRKDLTIGDMSIETGDSSADGFIVKVHEDGTTSGFWHFKSSNYVRISKLAVNPVTEALIVTGNFRSDMTYNDVSWQSAFYGDGFVMSINIDDGSMNWIQRFQPQSEFSSANGVALAIDQQGNIFVGLESFGVMEVDNVVFGFEPETGGIIISKFDSQGNLLESEMWEHLDFEGWIDINDMAIDENGNLITVGSTYGNAIITDSLFSFSPSSSEPFIIKQSNTLELQWLKKYTGFRCHIRDVYIDEGDILLSLQYHQFINLDGETYTGSGSWGDLLIISMDDNAVINWAKNFTLSQNEGAWGVYCDAITRWNNRYYLAGMYQGDVVHEETLILDNSTSGFTYQYPFMITLEVDGTFSSANGFLGSSQPCRITNMSSDETHLFFGGEFSGKLDHGDTILINDNNTSLFYGALKLDSVTDVKNSTSGEPVFSIYPTISTKFIHVEIDKSVEKLSLYSSLGELLQVYDQKPKLIDIHLLHAGQYYLVAVSEDGILHTKEFIKY